MRDTPESLKALYERNVRKRSYVSALTHLAELYFLEPEDAVQEDLEDRRQYVLRELERVPDLLQVGDRLKKDFDNCWRILTIGTEVIYEEYVLVLTNLSMCEFSARLLDVVGIKLDLDLNRLMSLLKRSVELAVNHQSYRSSLATMERNAPHLFQQSRLLAEAREFGGAG